MENVKTKENLETTQKQLSKRKDEMRFPTWLSGDIILINREYSFPCIIRDFSWCGLRLTAENFQNIPELFDINLPDENGNNIKRCKIAWRRNRNMGIQFC